MNMLRHLSGGSKSDLTSDPPEPSPPAEGAPNEVGPRAKRSIVVAQNVTRRQSVEGEQVWILSEKDLYVKAVMVEPGSNGQVLARLSLACSTDLPARCGGPHTSASPHASASPPAQTWITQATVTLNNGTEAQVKEYYSYDGRDEECEDLVQMVNVDPPNMLNTLRKRHELGISPYSNVGQESIVISLNPYRWFDIYTPKLMLEYYHADSAEKELGPHVFAIAAQAYRALCVTQASQSIVTSGESGSGKTENTKQVFRFLAEIAGANTAPLAVAEASGFEQVTTVPCSLHLALALTPASTFPPLPSPTLPPRPPPHLHFHPDLEQVAKEQILLHPLPTSHSPLTTHSTHYLLGGNGADPTAL